MSRNLHSRSTLQLLIGLCLGIPFGFLLQKGGITRYETVVNQLLFTDFTVFKIMFSAMITGMLGLHALKETGLIRLHPKPGSFGSSVIGGLTFGIGFAILGYCPGTIVGAAANGALDALCGGLAGAIIGSGIFAALFPILDKHLLKRGEFGNITIPQLLEVNPWGVVLPICGCIFALLIWLENAGL